MEPLAGQPLIALSHLSRFYQSGDTVVKALDDVSLSIYAGEFVAIMGQSGSGKSTLMNIVGCLDKPTAGVYEVDGRNASSLTPDDLADLRRETFGFIFQRYNLLAMSSAAENVEIPALYAGMKRSVRLERSRYLLNELGLGDRTDHRPSQLSGGQQQRVAVARALMNDPPVILADEPTGALDTRSGEDVMALLKALNDQGRTVVLITHDEHVASHARRIVKMQDGKIIEDSGRDEQARPVAHGHDRQDSVVRGATETAEAVTTALRALRANMFRTALTLLGIVIGVAAVITMLAVGEGSKRDVMEQISSMGTNLLSIHPGAPGVRSSGDNASLTPDDAKALINVPNVTSVVPQRSGRKTLRYGNIDAATNVQGVGEGFPFARDWALSHGTFFTTDDIDSYAAVIVLGSTIADTFFPHINPIGHYILVGNIPFEVIGVMAPKGAAPWGGDQDDTAYVPYTTGLVRLFGSAYLNSITVKVENVDIVEITQAQIEDILRARHGAEDFSVRNIASFLEMATAAQSALTILLGAVAAISLIVGGIGVMNIMLVSVTERTREIGIRMATGARMKDIMIQFNTEAAVVCTIGGILGVALGFSIGGALSLFGINIAFSTMPAVVAFSCAVATGLLFGYLPAKKAARLDPVVALSSE